MPALQKLLHSIGKRAKASHESNRPPANVIKARVVPSQVAPKWMALSS